MRILFYNHTGQVSGAERVLLALLQDVKDKPATQALLLCPPLSPLWKQAHAQGIYCEPIAELQARFTWRVDRLVQYLWSFAQVMRRFRRQVIRFQPELIHANSVRAGLVAFLATMLLRVPIVWHIHDSLPRHPFSILIRWIALSSSRNHLLGVSLAVIKRFRSRLSLFVHHPPMRVIYNGVAVDRFHFDPAGREAVREELKLREEELALGIIAQITPRKGQLELLRAFAAVLSQVPQATLLIVGAPLFKHDHTYLSRLQKTAHKLGIAERVRFLGARHDVPAVMQALDLVILNSHSDPFPLTMLEAMASGTPVLATAVDGIPELIRQGETGWLVPPRNEIALTEAIIRLLKDEPLRWNLATNGRQQILNGFTVEHFRHALEEYLHNVCAAERRALTPHPVRLDITI
ncbi:MAG: glycosyltransferase family 4 protein [Blastocatellia bacterium]|nr:glycosyltransferase family 4 protein [Blastocatellia bacterium]